MKKLVVSLISILSMLIGIILIYDNSNYKVLTNKIENNKINSNSLTMMYETYYQSGEYQVSNNNVWPQEGYTFNENLSKCENGSVLTWDDASKKILLQATVSDKCYVYFDKEPLTLANYIINSVYIEDGINDLYYHDGQGSYVNFDQEAGDNSYRYAGENPNNYVCYGSDEAVCTEDNLYRIIGVFDNQIKIIKNTSIGKYLWGTTKWSGITKPDMYTTLNTTYYGTLTSEWQELIDQNHKWKVGGMSESKVSATTKTVYDYEVGINQNGYEESMAIGLMYISDYGYGASPENWLLHLTNEYSEIQNSNWLKKSINEWTITQVNGWIPEYITYAINESGNVYTLSSGNANEIRPCFYLNSWVLYSSGDGTVSNPYRISKPDNLISFTVVGTKYYAEEGMTWEDWVNSIYNKDNFIIDNNSELKSNAGFIFQNSHQITINEVIEENVIYSLSSGGGAI